MKRKPTKEAELRNRNNALIATFLGWIHKKIGSSNRSAWHTQENLPVHYLYFDLDWEALHMVIDKIESLGFNFVIGRQGIQIWRWNPEYNKATDLIIDHDFLRDYAYPHKRKAVYESIISFIEWWNKNNADN